MCKRERCWTARLRRISDGSSDLRIRKDYDIAEVKPQTRNLSQTLRKMFQSRNIRKSHGGSQFVGDRGFSPVTPAWQSPSTPSPSIRVIEDVGSLLKLWDVERETLRTDIVSCEGENASLHVSHHMGMQGGDKGI